MEALKSSQLGLQKLYVYITGKVQATLQGRVGLYKM